MLLFLILGIVFNIISLPEVMTRLLLILQLAVFRILIIQHLVLKMTLDMLRNEETKFVLDRRMA
jgi:hypothetical protein